MVNKQNCSFNYSSPNHLHPNNNGNNNNPPEKSLSSLFRTYTEYNFCSDRVKDVDDNDKKTNLSPPSFTSICIDHTSPTSHGFNFDLANLDYSPSHRDLAEAEIHHILTDNLFKPVRRVSFSCHVDFISCFHVSNSCLQLMSPTTCLQLHVSNYSTVSTLSVIYLKTDIMSASNTWPDNTRLVM